VKAFPSTFTVQKNKKTGVSPFWILECPFPATGTVYLADYAVTFGSWKGGITTKGWVKNWGQITEDISEELGLTKVSSFRLNVIIDPNANPNMEAILENPANNAETTDCKLYLAYNELIGSSEATDPPQLMWRGNITDWPKQGELMLQLKMDDISVRLNKYIGTKLDLDDYPDACLDDVGKIMPIVYGPDNYVIGLRSAWGARTTLAAAITVSATSLTVSDGQYLPGSGSIWCDEEKIGYSGKTPSSDGVGGTTWTLNSLSRAQSGTTATAHSAGAEIAEYRSAYDSIIADRQLKAVKGMFADVGGKRLKVVSGVSPAVVNGRHLLRATQNITVQQVNDTIAVTDTIAVSDPGHKHGAMTTAKRYPTGSSHSAGGFTWDGVDLNVRDGADNTSLKARLDSSTSNYTASITATFPTYNGPTPESVYAIITHASFRGTPYPAGAHVYIGSTDLDMSATKATQRVYLGTSVPASLTVYCAHPNSASAYSMSMEVYEIYMEVTATETTTDPAGVEKSGQVEKTGNVVATRMVERFIALVDGYADDGAGTFTGTPNALIKRPDNIIADFLSAYAGWPVAQFYTNLALGTPIDSRLLGTIIGNMTDGGGLAAAFDGVRSQPASASARISDAGEDTRTVGTPIGDMTEGGGLAAAFDNQTSQPGANCARKTTGSLDLRTAGTATGNLTNGGGLAAAFDGVTSQAQVNGAYADRMSYSSGQIGKDWGENNAYIMTGFTLYAPSDAPFVSGGGTMDIWLYGYDGVSLITLYYATGVVQSNGQVYAVDSGIDTSTAYRWHLVNIRPTVSQNFRASVAELQFRASGAVATFGRMGKNWGTGVTKRAKGFSAYPSSDGGFLSTGGNIDIKFRGSTDGFVSSAVDLYTAANLSNTSPINVASGIDTSVAYQYHCLEIRPHGSSNVGDVVYLSELTLICFANGNLAGYVGKDWGSGVTRIVPGFSLYPPSDGGFLSTGGNINVRVLGSPDTNIGNALELYAAANLPGDAPINVPSGVSTSAYRCHWTEVSPAAYPSVDFSIRIAESVMDYTIPTGCENYAFSIVIDGGNYNTLKSWLAKMAWQCRCYFRFAAARAELLLRPDTLTSDKAITAHMTAMDSGHKTLTQTSRSALEEIINKIEAHYNRDASKSGTDAYRGIYKISDAASIVRYGEKEKPDLFNLDFIQDSTMAQSVAQFYLARYKDRKKVIKLDAFLNNGELEFGDGVTLEELSNLLCEVQQVNIEPGSGRDKTNDRIHLALKEY